MSTPVLQQVDAFLSGFARRQAERIVELPGGFAVLDETFGHSRMNNQIYIDAPVAPEALPAVADEVLGHLPHRLITVLDDAIAEACAEELARAGYSRSAYLVMVHEGPVPPDGRAAERVDLDALRTPLTRLWRAALPDVEDEVVRHLVDRRAARRRGGIVHFLAARTPEGEIASWADFYLDPERGIAQIEDLCTAPDQLRKGYADVVLGTALRLAADGGCGTRFLTADAADWPRRWYERRGFSAVGRFSCFERD
ncbi:GNAT family N-acetyltransferase [Streptomyces sp. TRM66268-LWL]|uniref:GNAT family N-acetyltransferase n=1 Tax=Streptomyces polyasparticus TaxID=2767826 RepID=A0ABR7SBL8_9ACTN|nr:GNAT family N-acetyltransferase [Streptomyces polyasparticus]MBC9712865.1 GNAT family N-acetyltransferase [Streptomyces polyasparticus]